jgi:hypothetical protein
LLERTLSVMRLMFVAIFAFFFLAWDIRQNDGHYTHKIVRSFDDLKREIGWR